MAANQVITPEAVKDIVDAYGWYEQQQSGLGTIFKKNVRKRINEICRSPQMHQIWTGVYRKATVWKFPSYIVVYHYDMATNTVNVHAVFHTSRDPKDLLKRLP